jgi:hypothetical protein
VKLCDRHFALGEYKPGPKEIKTSVHESFDVCESCYQEFINFMSPKKEVPIKNPVKKKSKK